MQVAVHLYPFAPWGMFGGSMRVRFSALATNSLGYDTRVYWWDAGTGRWLGPLTPDEVGRPLPEGQAAVSYSGRFHDLKRAVFPSALFETARKACAAEGLPPLGDASLVVLHTSLLTPAVEQIRQVGSARIAVDVHDLVYRTHEEDAGLAPRAWLRGIRRGYAASVRRRELAGLNGSDVVLMAGWTDDADYARTGGTANSFWAPTGLTVDFVERRESETLRVGILGNFAHVATYQPADALLESELAATPGVELVFAGLGSTEWAASRGTQALGTVGSVSEFYTGVDAVVLPVINASGMKTKLAEAALAGVPVLTTSAGAAGYEPDLRAWFSVAERLTDVSATAVRDHVRSIESHAMRAAFEARLGPNAATATYVEALDLPRALVAVAS